MRTSLLYLPLLALAAAFTACQPTATETATAPAATNTTAAADSTAAPSTAVTDHAGARAAVARYLQSQPDAQLYVVDSARVVDVDTHWQVLVPRTDWANRMPNRARFEVDKVNGMVQSLPVK
jgi:succinate dehydrogenase/fumarate reductase flavoprotein subunit